MSTPKTFCIKQLLTFCYLDLFGIPSEGDKRDSKHGLASHDFAPEPGELIPILICYSFVWELRAGSFSRAVMPVCPCLGSLAP
jgi:hypothetical protein